MSAWSRKSVTTLFRRFHDERRGSAVVQFAFVAPLFFCMLFAIIEVALIFFANQYLETATQDSARLILTGQAQTANYDKTQFKNDFCSRIVALFDCANGIYIDVKSYSSFSGISNASPVDASKNFDSSGLSYNPGNAGDIVVVRVFYQWPLFVTGLGFNVANLAGNKLLLTATAAFRNEPYSN
jgi:Flp pilus assembly protein TadG